MSFYELIYCKDDNQYSELQRSIAQRFPNARFEDGSDCIHEHRFSVQSNEEDQDRFIVFAIKEGFALSCFGVQLLLHCGDDHERLKRLIATARAQPV